MPLNTVDLQSSLTSFFTGIPAGDDVAAARAQCASQWANAMEAYSVGIAPPSTTVSAAVQALEAQLTTVFNGNILSILSGMETAFAAFAATVGTGMSPAFVATPPPSPVGFASLITPMPTASAAAGIWASTIDTWFRTGTAIPSGGGAAINWS